MRGYQKILFLSVVVNPTSTIDIGSEEVEFPVCLAIVAEHVYFDKVINLDTSIKSW